MKKIVYLMVFASLLMSCDKKQTGITSISLDTTEIKMTTPETYQLYVTEI